MNPQNPLARNRPWSRDELILALDAYFDVTPAAPDPTMPKIVALSARLRAMHPGELPPNFRSPSSVVMKLMNFRSLDPDYAGKGLDAVSRGDRETWAAFAADRAGLKTTAEAIRRALAAGYRPADGTPGEDIADAVEGRLLTLVHEARERSRLLVERKKASRLRETGSLQCEVCGFDFARSYGVRGEGFIECHHTKPLHLLHENEKTRLDDLALICANCHRMIHARHPWLSIDELRGCLTTVAT